MNWPSMDVIFEGGSCELSPCKAGSLDGWVLEWLNGWTNVFGAIWQGKHRLLTAVLICCITVLQWLQQHECCVAAQNALTLLQGRGIMLWDFVPLPIRGQIYRRFNVAMCRIFQAKHYCIHVNIQYSIVGLCFEIAHASRIIFSLVSGLVFDLELVHISWISKCAPCRSPSGWWLKMRGNKSVHVVLHGHCHRAWHLCSRRRCDGRSKSEWKPWKPCW